MKYLKLFEYVNEFQEISKDKYLSLTYPDNDNDHLWLKNDDEIEDISRQDITQIKNILKGKYLFQLGKDGTNVIHNLSIRSPEGPGGQGNHLIYDISKHRDEWFYVEHLISTLLLKSERKYYKCDQLSGLLDCLKSTEII